MFPRTRLGAISDEEWTNIDKGLPVHVGAVERAVAVKSVSGRIRRSWGL